MNFLNDKVAVVTGAGRGIGRAVAIAYAKMGANVVCVSRTQENSTKVATEIEALGQKSWAFAVDVSDTSAVESSAKNILERSFNNINVIGEISNISRPSSGHIYFTLKDDDAAIRCAMFRNQNLKLNFRPKNGDKCILNGQISLYALPRGL